MNNCSMSRCLFVNVRNCDMNGEQCEYYTEKVMMRVDKHGEWIEVKVNGGVDKICSVCKKSMIIYPTPYCPHCGAKMDLKQ